MNRTLGFAPVEMGWPQVSPHWCLTRDGDPVGLAIYRRHYSCRDPREERGGNYARFCGNGEHMVLIGIGADALFVWRKQSSRMDEQTGVECSVFRNEGPGLASLLIREAVALAWERWPGERLFTFVDERATASRRGKRKPAGWCFLCAGWETCEGRSKKRGLVVLECLPELAGGRERLAGNGREDGDSVGRRNIQPVVGLYPGE